MDTYFMSDFDNYQERALATAIYPDKGTGYIIYPTLGLCGEAGEVSEKVKKIIRDKKGIPSDEDIETLKKELGDVLWYISALAYELGFDLSDVALTNLEKLESRKTRGVLGGSGDNR